MVTSKFKSTIYFQRISNKEGDVFEIRRLATITTTTMTTTYRNEKYKRPEGI